MKATISGLLKKLIVLPNIQILDYRFLVSILPLNQLHYSEIQGCLCHALNFPSYRAMP
jgi:hypothetical protein